MIEKLSQHVLFFSLVQLLQKKKKKTPQPILVVLVEFSFKGDP